MFTYFSDDDDDEVVTRLILFVNNRNEETSRESDFKTFLELCLLVCVEVHHVSRYFILTQLL